MEEQELEGETTDEMSSSSTSKMSPLEKAVTACQRGSLEALESALSEGIKASDCDSDGCSLLHWASINNRTSLVEKLIKSGADPNILGGLLQSSPLHWAARVGHLASSAILVKAGAVSNVRDTQGYTPIHLAVQGIHIPLVAYLVEKYDYCKDLTDNSGMTPTMWAAYRTFGMFPIRLLIRAGADLNAKEHLQGNTALHMAAQEKNLSAVKELLLGGADVSAKNKQQETALDVARNSRNQKIIELLEDASRKQGLLPNKCCADESSTRYKRTFVFFLPSIVLAASALIYHILHYGIATGILVLALIAVQCLAKFSFHSAISTLLPIGIAVAEPICMICTWTWKLHWYAPWYLQILFIAVMFVLWMSFFSIVFKDPGVIRPDLDSHDKFVEAVESFRKVEFCYTCWIEKERGTKHCSVCDRCVRRFDHHCPWLNQCITRRNHRHFILYVFCVGAVSAIYTGAGVHLMFNDFKETDFDGVMQRHCWLLLTVLLAVIHAFALTSLFIGQCIQISEKVTTNEVLQHKSGRHHSGHGHSHSHGKVTCGGRIRNILEFCSSQS